MLLLLLLLLSKTRKGGAAAVAIAAVETREPAVCCCYCCRNLETGHVLLLLLELLLPKLRGRHIPYIRPRSIVREAIAGSSIETPHAKGSIPNQGRRMSRRRARGGGRCTEI